MATPQAAVNHYRIMQELQAKAVEAGMEQWSQIVPARIAASWTEQVETLAPLVADLQNRAAIEGATYSALALADQAAYVPPVEFVDPAAFAGTASDGRPLDTLIQSAAIGALSRIGAGAAPATALADAAEAFVSILQTVVSDAGRQAAGADLVTRPATGYVRFLNPPSCARCVVLAGKWFAWNAGFLRHPNCDCVHVIATAKSQGAAEREGLVLNQYDYFNSLNAAEQDKTFGKSGAVAIRDGADINQVVNASRGMTANGNFTDEGTTRRGIGGRNLRPGQRRMTPELIYQLSKSRDEALELLRYHGFILERGQVRNARVEGFGQMGAGGRRAAASNAVEQARLTGVRDPNSRYTMTAAERRLYDARQNYELALSGISPYTSPGFGNTPDPTGSRLNRVGATTRPVTPTELATAERQYRRMLATNGERFAR